MYSKILVPLDGSKTAEKVLPYARHLAGKFKIPVELLAVLDIAEMATHISAEKARHLDTMIEDGMRASTTYLRGIATTFPEGNVTCTVEKDRAEEAIIGKAGDGQRYADRHGDPRQIGNGPLPVGQRRRESAARQRQPFGARARQGRGEEQR